MMVDRKTLRPTRPASIIMLRVPNLSWCCKKLCMLSPKFAFESVFRSTLPYPLAKSYRALLRLEYKLHHLGFRRIDGDLLDRNPELFVPSLNCVGARREVL